MSVVTAKEQLITFLEDHLQKFKRVHGDEYQTRCPFCGDSSDRTHKGHLYINIDVTNENASPYICHKCQKKGIVDKELLNAFGFIDIPSDILRGMKEAKRVVSDKGYLIYDYKLPERYRYPNKIEYLCNRFEHRFAKEELQKYKVVTSLHDFLYLNKIKEFTASTEQLNRLERNYIGFLTTGNTHIIFRDVTGKEKFTYIEYPITKASENSKKFYHIINDLAIDTLEDTDIYICEGIFDSIGLDLFCKEKENQSVVCGALGKLYQTPLDRLVQLGVFGENVHVHLVLDNDKKFNHKEKNLDLEFMDRYRDIFGSEDIWTNMAYKDTGVPKNKINLSKFRI